MNNRDQRSGVFSAVLSYLIWGILPVYWKFLEHVNPGETLALRIFLVIYLYDHPVIIYKKTVFLSLNSFGGC